MLLPSNHAYLKKKQVHVNGVVALMEPWHIQKT